MLLVDMLYTVIRYSLRLLKRKYDLISNYTMCKDTLPVWSKAMSTLNITILRIHKFYLHEVNIRKELTMQDCSRSLRLLLKLHSDTPVPCQLRAHHVIRAHVQPIWVPILSSNSHQRRRFKMLLFQ